MESEGVNCNRVHVGIVATVTAVTSSKVTRA